MSDDVYQGVPKTPIAKGSRRRKCRKLVEYGLVECDGENRNRAYQVCDEDIGSPVGVQFPHSSR